jgi:hypothetical protein
MEIVGWKRTAYIYSLGGMHMPNHEDESQNVRPNAEITENLLSETSCREGIDMIGEEEEMADAAKEPYIDELPPSNLF